MQAAGAEYGSMLVFDGNEDLSSRLDSSQSECSINAANRSKLLCCTWLAHVTAGLLP